MFALKTAEGFFVSDEDTGHDVDYYSLTEAICGLKHHRAAAIVEFLGNGMRFSMSLEVAERRQVAEMQGRPFEMPVELTKFLHAPEEVEFCFGLLGVGDVFQLPDSPDLYAKRTKVLAFRLGPKDIPIAVVSLAEHAVVKPSVEVTERINAVLNLKVATTAEFFFGHRRQQA